MADDTIRSPNSTIRHPFPDELRVYFDLATKEDWNPGLELDESSILQVIDSEDLYVTQADGEIASTLACANHGQTHGWVGLYICKPHCRGKGYGLSLWKAAVDAPQF